MGATLAVALLLGAVVFGFPEKTRAFWPFSGLTSSAEAISAPVVTDSHLALLAAATNYDPNPNKSQRDIATTGGSALISEAGPEGTPPDTDATSGRISLYVVRSGDTLSDIAGMFGVSPNTILWANDLASAKDIHPGDTLLILPVSGIQHTVQKGETLASLAKTYGGDAEDIASFNGLDSGATLAVGAVVIIPGGEVKAVAKPTSGIGTPGPSRALPALSGYFGNPLPGAVLTQGLHGWNAVDLGAPSGTPVYAAAAGKVITVKVGGYNGGYGNYIVVSHANGTQTLYAHLSSVTVSSGAEVARGDMIGRVGSTGRSTGPHLHFEVRGAKNPFAQ